MRLYHILALMLIVWVIMPVFTLARTKRDKRSIVRIETTEGVIRIALYDDMPIHRDNFLDHVDCGFYDGLLFHRVIKDFMIQAGNSQSRTAKAGEVIGDSLAAPDTVNVIPSEIRLPSYYHRRGVVAAAREGDDVNPRRMSSSEEFYIVWGRTFSTRQLHDMRERIEANTFGEETLTSQMSHDYETIGGTPHLDGAYTVFGEVIEGLKVVDRIQQSVTDQHDRPVVDVRILRAYVEQRSKKAMQQPQKRVTIHR